MPEKRVLHIKHKLSADGATLVEYNFAKELQGKVVYDWLVFAEEGNDRAHLFEEMGGKVYVFHHIRRKFKLINKIVERRELRQFFRDHPYDIIHIDTDSLRRADVLYCAKKEGVRQRIIHSHNSQGEAAKRSLEKYKIVQDIRRNRIARLATDYLTCSNLAAEWMFTEKLRKEGKVVFIRNGIDGQRYLFDEEKRNRIRGELGIDDSIKLIGHVGRFAEAKNHKFLIEAFKEASDRDGSLRLLLIGSGELREAMISRINELGISSRVILIENTDKVEEYLFAMDIFALPSLHEGLPLTCLEAQASGLPTLMADSITRETEISSLASFLPIDSTGIWAEKFISVPKQSKEARIEANKGLKEHGFEIKDVADSLLKIYGG